MKGELVVAQSTNGSAVFFDVGDNEDFFVLPIGLFANVFHSLPEVIGKSDLIIFGEVLISEEDHAVVQQGLLDRPDRIVRKRLGEVQTFYFGTQGASGGNNCWHG